MSYSTSSGVQQNNGTKCTSYCISIIVWKEVHCQLCSTTVRINNWLKRTSAIKIATVLWKLQTIFATNGSHHVSFTKLTLFAVSKMNGTQRRALISPWRMHCMYSGMAKGTSWAEATSNSKKKKKKKSSHSLNQVNESGGIRQVIT